MPRGKNTGNKGANALQTVDLSKLESTTDEDLTQILKARYEQDCIYTRIGDQALVSVNPNKSLSICTDDQSLNYVAEYKDTSGQNANQLPPHIFQLVNQTYLHMRRTGVDQSIIISGDSGSGKTDAHKLALRHLVALSSHKKPSKIQTQLLHSQAILEAFGNAKTTQNNNASRFGRYTEVQFSERGRITGAKLLNYFLEKRRVTSAPEDERNFHAFYYLLAGVPAEEKAELRLSDHSSFAYLSRCRSQTTADDATKFEELKTSLKALGFQKKHIARLMQLLAAILHLGNIIFVDDPSKGQDAANVKNVEVLSLAADFLGVDPHALELVLTYKTKLIKKDVTTVFLNAEQASKQRDELATALYSLMFTWIVEQINIKLCNDNFHSFIGIVDLPGPQTTQSSGQAKFEQYCVNYSNEKFHDFVLRQIFEQDNDIYEQDGIKMPNVPYFSNAACVQLFDKPSNGLNAILSECTAKAQKRTDDNMLDSFVKYNNNHDSFSNRNADTGARQFTVQHFANQVAYTPYGFIEDNGDALSADFVNLFRGNAETSGSFNSFVLNLFSQQAVSTQSHPKSSDDIVAAQQIAKPGRAPSMRRSKSQRKSGTGKTDQDNLVKVKGDTKGTTAASIGVISQLQSALEELIATLEETTPWFIFCLSPNTSGSVNMFDSKRVKAQVRSYGLPEIAKRWANNYTMILDHEEFLTRYQDILLSMGVEEDRLPRSKCEAVGTMFGWTSAQMAIGSMNVYLSESSWRNLEDSLRGQDKEEQRKAKEERKKDDGSELIPAVAGGAAAGGLLNVYEEKSGFSEDQHSYYSEDEYAQDEQYSGYQENESTFGSEAYGNVPGREMETKRMLPNDTDAVDIDQTENKPTAGRRRWLWFVMFLTWWVPKPFMIWCGRMKRKDIRVAWREKFALCIIIFLMSAFIIWFLVFFGELICPHQDVYSQSELQSHNDKNGAYVAIRGEVFDLTSFAPHHWAIDVIPVSSILNNYMGTDATNLFPVQVSALCDGTTGSVSPFVSLDYQINLTDTNAQYHDFRYFTNDYRPDWYFEQMQMMRKLYKVGRMAFDPSDVYKQATTSTVMNGISAYRQWAILNNNVYDLTYYIMGGRYLKGPNNQTAPAGTSTDFLDTSVVELFRQLAGQDITDSWNKLPLDSALRDRMEVCLQNLFQVGVVDSRNSARCLFSEYLLLIITVLLCAVIVFKFLAALQLGSRREPEEYDKFIICQVPCYTESEESLKKTIDSIAVLKYDDKRKLLFIICDGMLIGSGNDRPTPRIVLDILGVDPNVDPEPLSFLSLGEGQKQHNMGKVYSGLYEIAGHVVPYIVVAKVGKPSERQKPGNRGKRDSQMILMRFLNKVHFDSAMTPMDLEIFHQIKNVIGVNPSFYEFILMVDADTEVLPDALNRMVSCFVHDAKVIGLCGETTLANEKDSWVTMIQVYEYYISHHLTKAFESLFGSVTCLPGCFSMYRVRSALKNQPLLVSNQVIQDYEVNVVDTLHKKNLLHLGEDRYLTTLILKHFPNYKTKFTPDATCKTNAPDTWSILLSQRRRWINSTVHNLGELVFLPQLCGFCCFSMRFVVFIDLISTLVMPATVGYMAYLIYELATSPNGVPVWSIVTIAAVYGLQAFIFIINRKWEHIGWMIVSIFAIPVFSLYIPVYSFWHFDDFSWGNTRVVVGESGKRVLVPEDQGKFDPKSIPTMTWTQYEEGLFREDGAGAWNDNASVGSHRTGYTQGSYRSHPSHQMAAQSAYGEGASMYDEQLYGGRSRSRSPAPMVPFNDAASFHPSLGGGMGMNPRMSTAYSDMMSQRGPAFGSQADFSAYAMSRPGSTMMPASSSMMDYYGAATSGSVQGEAMPSNEQIMDEVRNILANADLMSITKKQVRDRLSEMFGVPMSSKKEYINSCIETVLRGDN
ncbi:hypothetical protein K450DRAFT_241387 [Umbelopsis ramanniana AG]|uniref:chitin synthase n=1 Tax=Umbelopsis ramanniana AG TaxID=1314678 RepID=A0AAD5E8T1_UMBRA|nr:uncharacterized protein K450DRAFT_241387 [Umbelopsis ramanniana AG]KAI8579523.1 hypothetical protein K450DRAFT_241387 [Umbelopsis ramanniana AG]